MAWSSLRLPLADLLTIHARMERLRLVKKLAACEMHMRAAGLDPTDIVRARQELLAQPVTGHASGLVVPPPPPPPVRADGSPRLRYLHVTESRHV